MAQLVKLTFTKPIPAGAKIIERKGERFARFKGPGGTVEAPLTEDGTRVRLESRCWYADWRDANGKRCRKKLCTNREAAKVMLGELVTKLERQEAGITDAFEDERRRPLADHVEDYCRNLVAKGRTKAYADKARGQILAVLRACKFTFIADVATTRVQAFLAEMREDRAAPKIPGGEEWFTVTEVAELLGVSITAVHYNIGRHELPTKREGFKVLIRRDGVLRLAELAAQGHSVGTTNQYGIQLRSFGKWLVKNRRHGENPFTGVTGGNAKADRRHERRALEHDDLRRLLQATRESGRTVRGLTGYDRCLIYSVAACTGLRAHELGTLTPADFDLGGSPIVHVAAANAKNGKAADQPLHPDLVPVLREYLSDRPTHAPVWSGDWWKNGAAMLRADLRAANIPYRDDAGRVFDFHSLRVSFITALARSGVHPKTAQELARHSSIDLTMNVYSKLTLRDLSGAVDGLPSLFPAGTEAARATGTDGRQLVPSLSRACPTGDSACGPVRMADETAEVLPLRLHPRQTAENAGNDNGCGPVSAADEEPPADHKNMNHGTSHSKIDSHKALPGKSCGAKDNQLVRGLSSGAKTDDGLAAVIAAWPTLSADARAAILAVVERARAGR